MSSRTHTRLNLVVDDKLREILAYFRAKYPLLKDVDIIKMAVSGFYTAEIDMLPIDDFDELQDQSLLKSVKSKASDQPAFGEVSDLIDYLDK